MEAFTELIRREPTLLDRPLKELVPISFLGGVAVSAYRALVSKLDNLPMSEEQKKKTLKDGQEAGTMLLAIEARIGELLPSEEEAMKTHGGKLSGYHRTLPDEFGDDERHRKYRSHIARAIARHPEAVEKIIEEAEENEDIPTKTAVLKEIQLQRQRKYDEEHKGEIKKTKAEMTLAQIEYVNILEWIIEKLPHEPPMDWNENSLAYATGLIKVILKRLEVFINVKDENNTRRCIDNTS